MTSIDLTPGTRLLHQQRFVVDGNARELLWPYIVVGLAWDVRGHSWRVILRDDSDTPANGRLLIFTEDVVVRSFFPAPTAPAEAEEKVAGSYQPVENPA